MKIKLEIEVEVNEGGEYELYDTPCYICPEHMEGERELKQCFLDTLNAVLEYGIFDDENLTKGAIALKNTVLDSIQIIKGEI